MRLLDSLILSKNSQDALYSGMEGVCSKKTDNI
jgi:hypothetical protein